MAFNNKEIFEQETKTNELTDHASQTCKAGYVTQKIHVEDDFIDVVPNSVVNLSSFKFDTLDTLSGIVKKCIDKTSIHKGCCSDYIGIKVGLIKCSAAQISLAVERSKGNCGYIGEYCSKKILGLCITKTKSYCCFPTVLAKILRYGVLDQLGKSLDSAEHPQCGGITLQIIEKIDFGLINFDEFFSLEAHKTIKAYNNQANSNPSVTIENINLVKTFSEINMDLWNDFKEKSIVDSCQAIENFVVALDLPITSKDRDFIVDSVVINKEECHQRASSILDSVFIQANIQKFILVDQQKKDNSHSEFETMYENLADQQVRALPLFGETKDNVQEEA